MNEDTNIGRGFHESYDSPEEREIEDLEKLVRNYGKIILERNKRIAQLELEAHDDAVIRAKMRDILVEVTNLLKGDPGPLKQWGWHDLPDLVRSRCAIQARHPQAGLMELKVKQSDIDPDELLAMQKESAP